ncbi:ABC transporter substrate-binding protein [Treponema sp.]|uniref:ABC transporter substrate-binding protein n=1 Tax=Treponema sp. TaxID=166 RepID=UPI00388EF79C
MKNNGGSKGFKPLCLAGLVCLALITACSLHRPKAAKESFASRVVCLSPAGAEILHAIGAGEKIIARTDFCDYPPEVLKLPSVGGFDGRTLSVENIVACRPDLVYGAKGMHDFLVQPLESLGIKVYLSSAGTVDAIYDEMEEVSVLVGCAENGKSYVESHRPLRQLYEYAVPVYYEVWYAPYMSTGRSFVSDVISYAGGASIFAALDEAYPMISEEAVIAAKPEVIIIPRQNGVTAEAVMERKGWQDIPAVKNGRVYLVDGDVVSRPGPRIVDAVEELKNAIR